MPLFDHQQATVNFLAANENAFISSDPGTGKSRCILEHVRAHRAKGRALIFAPKSILQPSWAEDIKKFTPELTYAIAGTKDRHAAFTMATDIVLINHDAAKWVSQNLHVLKGFYTLCIDESTAFKNYKSQRSEAMEKIANLIPNRIGMSGTMNPNGLLDVFNQIKLVDGGERLGKSYWAFRASTHTPVSRGPFTEWEEKEGIQDAVYGLIQDINIRFELEKCISMPEKIVTEVKFDLSPKHFALYEELRKQALLQLNDGDISAINAASLATKLMQAASGSVYDTAGTAIQLATDRYELILDLVEQRDQCLVAFNWGHQRDKLVELAKKRGLTYDVIDGKVDIDKRNYAVEAFQAGKTKVLFAHPQSASHGLTLTNGTTTIWSSPTYNAEHYSQFCRRIFRAGQTKRTETIHITARNTIDEKAYTRLMQKCTGMNSLLELLSL
jgi:SNF2 family DNA or RNA helicase